MSEAASVSGCVLCTGWSRVRWQPGSHPRCGECGIEKDAGGLCHTMHPLPKANQAWPKVLAIKRL